MMKTTKHRPHRVFSLLFSAWLTVFTVFVLLDTFAISRVYEQVAPNVMEMTSDGEIQDQSQAANAFANAFIDDSSVFITLQTHRIHDTDVYVADVKLRDIHFLKTAFAHDAYGRNIKEKTSVMAERLGALLAINGDYYGARQDGYVIRNGVLYRDKAARNQEDLVIYADGSFGIIREHEVSVDSLLQADALHVFSFGPALLENGAIVVNADDRVGKTHNPRTAIAMIEPLHYLFLVADGRTDESKGLSLMQMAEFLLSLGATTAYNLDGGGSSTLYHQGEVINHPTTNGLSIAERQVSDIVYIGE